jgi:hypothetical protein
MDATETDRRQQRNRTRFELRLPADQLAARAATALAAGGRTVGEPTPDRHHLADPEGNELVLIAPA